MLGINRRVGCWEKLVARHLVDERLRIRSRIEVAAIPDRISGREWTMTSYTGSTAIPATRSATNRVASRVFNETIQITDLRNGHLLLPRTLKNKTNQLFHSRHFLHLLFRTKYQYDCLVCLTFIAHKSGCQCFSCENSQPLASVYGLV